MARARYRITDQDYWHAYSWLEAKLKDTKTFFDWFDGDTSKAVKAEREFNKIQSGDAEALNGWAEQWFSGAIWTQMKYAIRARRKRGLEKYDVEKAKKQVTLEHHAWQILSTIAEKEGVTLSQVINTYLNKQYLQYIGLANKR